MLIPKQMFQRLPIALAQRIPQYKSIMQKWIYMNFENSKISDPHRLSRNLMGKIDLRRTDKNIAFSNLSFYYTWKNIKK